MGLVLAVPHDERGERDEENNRWHPVHRQRVNQRVDGRVKLGPSSGPKRCQRWRHLALPKYSPALRYPYAAIAAAAGVCCAAILNSSSVPRTSMSGWRVLVNRSYIGCFAARQRAS